MIQYHYFNVNSHQGMEKNGVDVTWQTQVGGPALLRRARRSETKKKKAKKSKKNKKKQKKKAKKI